MAPQAKISLVESVLCTAPQCATDPKWNAVTRAAKLVAAAGGRVVSMSFGDREISQELSFDKYFTNQKVVFFAASRQSGLIHSSYPRSTPHADPVGTSFFNT